MLGILVILDIMVTYAADQTQILFKFDDNMIDIIIVSWWNAYMTIVSTTNPSQGYTAASYEVNFILSK